MVAFANGMVFLYDDYQDLKPLKFVTDFSEIIYADWNPSGDIIAIAGSILDQTVNEKREAVNFYSPEGILLKVLKIPNPITCFCWDGNGTKLAITTESIILFALVKPRYKWTYFSDTLVYSFMTESDHHSMVFWDVKKKH